MIDKPRSRNGAVGRSSDTLRSGSDRKAEWIFIVVKFRRGDAGPHPERETSTSSYHARKNPVHAHNFNNCRKRPCVKKMRRLAKSPGAPQNAPKSGLVFQTLFKPTVTEIRSNARSTHRIHLGIVPGRSDDFELWRWGVSPMFDMDAADRRARSSFALDATACQFADVAVSSTRSSVTRFERSAPVIARSGMDSIVVLIYLAGGYSLDVEGRSLEVNAGDACILDLTRRSTLRTTDYTNLSILLPRAMLEPLAPNLDDLHGMVLPHGRPLNTLLVAHLRTLHAESPGLGLTDGRAAAHGAAALIAAFAGPSADGYKTAAQAVAAASLQAARRSIEINLANPELGPDFLARQMGVSRAKLYRLFEPLGGVRNYIQQRRLTRAFQTIADPAQARERVSAIAARYGFTSDSTFSRAFRDAYGMSPSDMRATAQAGYREAIHTSFKGGGSFWTMNRWLLGMDASGR